MRCKHYVHIGEFESGKFVTSKDFCLVMEEEARCGGEKMFCECDKFEERREV